MTTDLEKQFFSTFGIEPREYTQCTSMGCRDICGDCNNCQFHNIYKIDYPQITSDILLELICILSKYQKDVGSLLEICETDKNSIKVEVLDMLIFRDIALKLQVQALFKE